MAKDGRLEEERRLCYVGITRARKHLALSLARRRTLFNQISFNPPSSFISEIPQELLADDWGKTMRKHFGPADHQEMTVRRPVQRQAKMGFGIPGMGQKPLQIPGVRRGFIPSTAREEAEATAAAMVFKPGDKVLHKKFGEGRVLELSGTGTDTRISIHFTAYGDKQFALHVAPIVKMG